MIFISHKHENHEIAEALVDFILSTINIRREQIRCTSTPGSQLPFGQSIEARLKDDINQSQVVIALLTQESKNAHWVLSELGASWALGKLIVPILAPDLPSADFPGPLSGYPRVVIGKPNATSLMIDVMRQVAQKLNASFDFDANSQRKLDLFIQAFSAAPKTSKITTPTPLQVKLFLLSNDFYMIVVALEHPEILKLDHQFLLGRDEAILQELEVNLQRPLEILSFDDVHKILVKVNAFLSVKHPTERKFFAAGWEFPQALANHDIDQARAILREINCPIAPTSDLGTIETSNLVRKYFEDFLSIQE